MPKKVLTGLDLNAPVTIAGSVGTAGQVLASGGANAIPTWVNSPATPSSLTIGSTGLTTTAGSGPWNGSLPATIDIDTSKVPLLTASQTFTGAQVITANADATIPLVTKWASASQSGDMVQFQKQDGTVLGRIRNSGQLSIGTLITGTGLAVDLTNLGATQKGIVVRGFSGQTANLQEWQNSAGTVIARIEPSGRFGNTGGSYIGGPNGQVFATTTSASTIPLISRGAASQSANLQEWQNSAGTSLARVANNGNMVAQEFYTTGGVFATGISTLTGLIVLGESFSGGTIRMTRATATQPSPGANQGRLYFRDGTNAGTLKLVVRAGTAGVETTLIDNIDQTGTDTSTLGVALIDGGTP